MKSRYTIGVSIWLILWWWLPTYASIGSQGIRQQVVSLTDICTTQFSVIESEITTSGFTIVESQLQGIESTLDTCCSQCESKLAAISTNNNGLSSSIATIESSLDELGNKFDSCCSTIDSQLDIIESKVDVVDSDLQVFSASNLEQIIKNLSAIDVMASDVDQTLSKMSELSSSIFDNLSDLDVIMAGVSTQLSTLDSKLSTCATQLDSQLDRIESKIDTNDNAITSQIGAIGSKLSVCCTQLDSQLDRIESKIDTNDSAIASQLPTIGSKVSVCATQLDSQLDRIESKIDTNDSAMGSQINAIDSKLAVCCTQLDSQLDRIESKIDTITVQVSVDLSPIVSKLDTCATQIDSQLDRIESKIDTTDTTIINQLASIDSKLSVCCTQLDSQLDRIENKLASCAGTPITTSTTLSVPGAYCLANNISGDVAITGSNIILDLAGRTISGGTYGITISGNNVTVKNGTIQNATSANIYLTGNKCLIEGCDLVGSITGLQIINCSLNRIYDCYAINNTSIGFCLIGSYTNNIVGCEALSTIGNSEVYGFITNSGSNNLFEACKAEDTRCTSTYNGSATGFALMSEINSKILQSDCFNVQALTPFGMQFLRSSTQVNYGPLPINVPKSVAWSPDNQYLAIGGTTITGGNEVQIYGFNGVSLNYITGYNFDVQVNSVAWSYAGLYLAVATAAHSPDLCVFKFNGAALTLSDSKNLSQNVNAVSWSPYYVSSQYVAVGSDTGGTTNPLQIYVYTPSVDNLFRVVDFSTAGSVVSLSWSPNGTCLVDGQINALDTYSFNYSTNVLSGIDVYGLPAGSIAVQWSPDGNYIAYGNNRLNIHSVNSSGYMTPITSTGSLGGQVKVSWSADSKYLATGVYQSSVDFELGIYYFNNNVLSLTDQFDYGDATAGISTVAWRLNTNIIAVGGAPTSASPGTIKIYNLTYPYGNLIANNLVTDVHSASGSLGIGYSVNACTNLFMDNTAYNNDTNTVFTSTCSGINIHSQVDLIASKLDLPACSLTPITAAGTISTAGSYYLANNISGSLLITGTNISIDLSGYTVSPVSTVTGIKITGSNVILKNGKISGGCDGILLSGASQCLITSVTCDGQVGHAGIYLTNGSNNNTFTNNLTSNITNGGSGWNIDPSCSFNSFIGCTIDTVKSYLAVSSNAYGILGCGFVPGPDQSLSGTGMVIDGCTIKNIFGLDSNALVVTGMRINGATSWVVTRNIIANIAGKVARGSGIEAHDSPVINCIFANNLITTVTATDAWAGIYGIDLGGKDLNCAKINNMVSLQATGTAAYQFSSTGSYNNQSNSYL